MIFSKGRQKENVQIKYNINLLKLLLILTTWEKYLAEQDLLKLQYRN